MKTILVDAVGAFVVDGKIYKPLYDLLEEYPNRKIILTNADDEQMKTFGLVGMPYEVFTLRHNPDKPDAAYFRKFLEQYNLPEEEVIYFEHNPDAVKSAESVGIVSYYYDSEQKNIDDLRKFIDENL